VYDTGAGGAAMVAIGVAGLAAGAALFAVDTIVRRRASKAPAVSIMPTPNGVWAGVSARF
jgi:hypothetical protein